MPEKGCNVEWTVVEIPSSETCWTLGFEAYGHLQDVENSLQSVGTSDDRTKSAACAWRDCHQLCQIDCEAVFQVGVLPAPLTNVP
jgi:hypothetical protein